jgi:hypothetical protein
VEVRVAQKVTVILQDDLDGTPAAETVRFALDGVEYEIDLSEENARTFRRQLEPYIQRSRTVGRGRPRRQRRTAAGRENSEAIREWAKARGLVVGDRGRIPATVAHEYEQVVGRRPPGPISVPPRRPKPPKAL